MVGASAGRRSRAVGKTLIPWRRPRPVSEVSVRIVDRDVPSVWLGTAGRHRRRTDAGPPRGRRGGDRPPPRWRPCRPSPRRPRRPPRRRRDRQRVGEKRTAVHGGGAQSGRRPPPPRRAASTRPPAATRRRRPPRARTPPVGRRHAPATGGGGTPPRAVGRAGGCNDRRAVGRGPRATLGGSAAVGPPPAPSAAWRPPPPPRAAARAAPRASAPRVASPGRPAGGHAAGPSRAVVAPPRSPVSPPPRRFTIPAPLHRCGGAAAAPLQRARAAAQCSRAETGPAVTKWVVPPIVSLPADCFNPRLDVLVFCHVAGLIFVARLHCCERCGRICTGPNKSSLSTVGRIARCPGSTLRITPVCGSGPRSGGACASTVVAGPPLGSPLHAGWMWAGTPRYFCQPG